MTSEIGREEVERIVKNEVAAAVAEKMAIEIYEQLSKSDSEESASSERLKKLKVPVPGRTNRGEYTEITIDPGPGPKKVAKEIPIEGGDVEDPDTFEIEVEEPRPDPRLPDHLSPAEVREVVREEVIVEEESRNNQDEEMKPEDVPAPGQKWDEDGGEENDSEDNSSEDIRWYQ